MHEENNRRAILAVATGILFAACKKVQPADAAPSPAASSRGASRPGEQAANEKKAEDVSAVEDLMREHGVIRRVLVVYRESAIRLRGKASSVPPDALQKAAKLIRVFGEDYHETKLEEAHLFPAVKKGGTAAT